MERGCLWALVAGLAVVVLAAVAGVCGYQVGYARGVQRMVTSYEGIVAQELKTWRGACERDEQPLLRASPGFRHLFGSFLKGLAMRGRVHGVLDARQRGDAAAVTLIEADAAALEALAGRLVHAKEPAAPQPPAARPDDNAAGPTGPTRGRQGRGGST